MRATKTTIEQRAASTILGKPFVVSAGGKDYNVAPPTLATLIEVSALVSELPDEAPTISDKIVQECLRTAKHWRILGDITALLILGAERPDHGAKRLISGFKNGLFRIVGRKSERETLAEDIVSFNSPNEILYIISKILGTLQLNDFFALTTFLKETNVLAPMKVAEKTENKTTAFGQ